MEIIFITLRADEQKTSPNSKLKINRYAVITGHADLRWLD